MKQIHSALGVALVGLTATAHADVTFGGARAAGMGGAGLALPVDIGNNYRMNPAFLAFGSKSPTIQWPGLGYKLDGISLSNVNDVVGSINHGGLDASGILALARKYADTPKAIGVNGSVGFRFAGLAVGASGEAGINSIPNAPLQTWAQSGGSINNLPPTAREDAYGFGYQQVEVAYGNSVRTTSGKFTLGANVRRVKAYYAHKFADSATIQNNDQNGVQNGSGIVGDFTTQDGTGVDIGMLYNFPGNNELYLGALVQNIVQPNIKFNFEPPGGGQAIIPNGFDPFKRTVNAGLGWVHSKFLLAADLVDIGNNSGGQQFRAGAEYQVSGNTYLRAGYNSQTAFTYGLSLGGFNVQIGGKAPLSITSLVRF